MVSRSSFHHFLFLFFVNSCIEAKISQHCFGCFQQHITVCNSLFLVICIMYTFSMSKFYVVLGIKAFRSHYFYSLLFTANFAFEPNQSHFLVPIICVSTLFVVCMLIINSGNGISSLINVYAAEWYVDSTLYYNRYRVLGRIRDNQNLSSAEYILLLSPRPQQRPH